MNDLLTAFSELPQKTQLTIIYVVGVVLHFLFIRLFTYSVISSMKFETIIASLLWPLLMLRMMAGFILMLFKQQP